jgi:hypothetical protein
MTTYELYVETGPRQRATMVHVPQLLGCVVVRPTMRQALEETPPAIARFLRMRRRHGDDPDLEARFDIHVAGQSREGLMLALPTDMTALSDEAIEHALDQLGWINEELAVWADAQPPDVLAAVPPTGWPARKIVLHVIASQGGYLESALGAGPDTAPVRRNASRGAISLGEGLRETVRLCRECVARATPEQRRGIRQMPWGPYTLHRALRRLNEHAWEHLDELSRRPGGPEL